MRESMWMTKNKELGYSTGSQETSTRESTSMMKERGLGRWGGMMDQCTLGNGLEEFRMGMGE